MKHVSKAIRKFWIEYDLYSAPLDLNRLKSIIAYQGFTLVPFGVSCEPAVLQLIKTLKVENLCESQNGFTYCNGGAKLVFLRDTLNSADMLSVLLHEEGHIFFEHFFHDGNLDDTDTCHENEANAFALRILRKIKKDKTVRRIKSRLSWVYKLSVLLILALLFALGRTYCIPSHANTSVSAPPTDAAAVTALETACAVPLSDITESKASDLSPAEGNTLICYWTPGGTVYHIYPDCQHLKNSLTVLSGTQTDSKKPRCCKTCHNRYLNEQYNSKEN